MVLFNFCAEFPFYGILYHQPMFLMGLFQVEQLLQHFLLVL